MWCKLAHTLVPLTKLCSTKVKFYCTDVEAKYFVDMKQNILMRRVALIPNFLVGSLKTHTDAGKM